MIMKGHEKKEKYILGKAKVLKNGKIILKFKDKEKAILALNFLNNMLMGKNF